MGYSDDECVVCYQRSGSNNYLCSWVDICLHCLDKLLREYTTVNVLSMISEAMKDAQCGPKDDEDQDECYLCSQIGRVLIEIPCCDDHQGTFLAD